MARKRTRPRPGFTAQSTASMPPATGRVPDVQKPNTRAYAQYDAARHGRRMRGWSAPSTGPARATEGLETIRNRTRDAARNDWSAAASVRAWTTNLVGAGIVPRPKTKNTDLKRRLLDLWEEWVADADADGVLDFYGLQTLVVRSWLLSGEVFVRLRRRRLEDGLRVPLQLQVIESDQLPMFSTDSWPGLHPGHTICQGVEFDHIGRRVAYWFHRNHPGDRPRTATPEYGSLSRVPKTHLLHIFEPVRPGQVRGVSDLAAVLTKLRGVMDYDDAVLERQRLANLFTLFVTRAPGGPSPLDMVTGQPEMADIDLVRMEPGLVQELAPGEDVKFSDPPDSGSGYDDFVRAQHLGISAGQGLPYELLTGDLRDVSDRSLRIILNEFRRHCGQRQWQIIIPQLCRPVWRAWCQAAVLGGDVKVSEAKEAERVDWAPEAWAYIHPVQDVQAKRIEVEAGFRSRAQVIAATGEDPEEVDRLRAEDATRDRRVRPGGGG